MEWHWGAAVRTGVVALVVVPTMVAAGFIVVVVVNVGDGAVDIPT